MFKSSLRRGSAEGTQFESGLDSGSEELALCFTFDLPAREIFSHSVGSGVPATRDSDHPVAGGLRQNQH